jgi:hypothetical protein
LLFSGYIRLQTKTKKVKKDSSEEEAEAEAAPTEGTASGSGLQKNDDGDKFLDVRARSIDHFPLDEGRLTKDVLLL